MPISLHVLIEALSVTLKKKGMYGPIRKPAEYVAQNERLIQFFENDGDDAAGQKYDSKVGNKFRQMQY